MVAVDTNILVRFIVKDNPALTKKAAEVLKHAKPATFWLDRLILSELDYVLMSYYQYNKEERIAVLRSLVNDETFIIPDQELVWLTIKLFESEKPLSFEDCWLLALKRAGKVESIATFDENLVKRETRV